MWGARARYRSQAHRRGDGSRTTRTTRTRPWIHRRPTRTDLDSVVSAVAYAFLNSPAEEDASDVGATAPATSTATTATADVPVINVARKEFGLRTEVVHLFKRLGYVCAPGWSGAGPLGLTGCAPRRPPPSVLLFSA